jgi:signal transduction histidine kinase
MFKRLKYFLILFIIASMVLSWIYISERRNSITALKASEMDHLHAEIATLQMTFRSITTDLHFLSNMRELKNYLSNPKPILRDEMCCELKRYAMAKGNYEQIRFLDTNGMEIMRIDMKSGIAKQVPDHQLQDKSNRYYFKDALKLKEHEVYVSPIDLNVEHGEIEKPINPMIRFVEPVFDSLGVKRGVIILNYRSKNILEIVSDTKRDRRHIQTFLINQNSYYIIGPTPEDEWGFMFEQRFERNMENQFPDAWNSISNTNMGLFLSEKGFFIYHTVNPLPSSTVSSTGANSADGDSECSVDSAEYYWKLVSYLQTDDFHEINFKRFLPYYLLFAIFSFILANIFASLKEKQIRAQNEVKRANALLKEQNGELKEAIDTKNKFFSIIGHDLRNPMSVVIGYTSMLIDNCEFMTIDEVKEYFGDIERATSKLMQLLENLLEWAQSQTGSIKFKPHEVELSNLVEKAVSPVKMSAKKKKIFIGVSVPSILTAYIDENMITTVIRNLLTNAVKFTPSEGHITITATPNGVDLVEIRIQDTGLGMTEEECGNLFNIKSKYSKVGTNGEEGTGLGLILTVEFLRKNGGSIKVKSVVDEGSTFIITLPRKNTDMI